MSRKALIVGATGLVGKSLLEILLRKDYYEEIVILTRRKIKSNDRRLTHIQMDDFDELASCNDKLNVHDVYCAIGTTRNKAGSREAFRKVDVGYPVALAKVTMHQPNFQNFLVVSSFGANPNSPLFYNKTKGELENELEKLNMDSLKIFQPSLLLGTRDEFRFLEEVGKLATRFLTFFMVGREKKSWTIHDYEVAEAMYVVAKANIKGTKRFKPMNMLKLSHT